MSAKSATDGGRVWITGASQGIGAAVAQAYAERGWQVAISARRPEPLRRLAAQHPGLHPFVFDVQQRSAYPALLDSIEQTLGPLDLVILNAGTHQPQTAQQLDSDTVRNLFELNFMGTLYGIEALLPRMLERAKHSERRQQIAVVASLAGYRGLPAAAGYGASKAALINLCEALRLDLADSGVELRLINPGFVKTPLTDRNRFRMPMLQSPEQAASAIIAGLQGQRFEIRFPGLFANLMGLLRHLPYRLYFPLIKQITGV